MFRIGVVTDVNGSERTARVLFKAENIVSGWLKIIKSPPFIPEKDKEQKTEIENLHSHEIIISPWLPNIGDIVLCAYNSGFNEDGFILGAL